MLEVRPQLRTDVVHRSRAARRRNSYRFPKAVPERSDSSRIRYVPNHPNPHKQPLTLPGLTETSTVVSSTHPHDIFLGSSGALIPGFEARIMTPENEEITKYDTPGELVVRGPSVVLGYLNNDKATKETFEDGWMRTGDEAVIRLSPKGVEHVFIVDRIKELIKVKVCDVWMTECQQ